MCAQRYVCTKRLDKEGVSALLRFECCVRVYDTCPCSSCCSVLTYMTCTLVLLAIHVILSLQDSISYSMFLRKCANGIIK